MEQLKISYFIDYIKKIDMDSWVILILLLIFAITLFLKRKSPIVKELVTNAIIDAENRFNSGQGQQKLEYAVMVVQQNLPFIIRIFFTKSILITIIENTLNSLCHTFEIDKKVNINGNDEMCPIVRKINLDIEKKKIGVEVSNKGYGKTDIDTATNEIYASIKARTDFKDENEAIVEVGIKKKF